MTATTLILFIIGFVLLVGGAEFLVRGASRLAVATGISPLVVGLTVVAYGTSAPELAVTIQASFAGQADIAIGNVVGSNIANILLVLGLSAVVAPLIVAKQLVRLDIPLMIGLSFLVLIMSLDGIISRLDGIILFSGAVTYTIFTIGQGRKEVQAQYEPGFDGHKANLKGPAQIFIQFGLITIGVVMVIFGSRWLIDGAVAIAQWLGVSNAQWLGVSKLIIGLTIVAVGTSLPEVATSVVASWRNERDIAVGNVVGSNIFNILSVLGLVSIVAPAGVNVSPAALSFNIPLMIAVAIVCLPIFFTGYRIERWEGLMFLGYYVAYMVYLYLQAIQHDALTTFSTIMILVVIPITALTILVSLVRHFQFNRRSVVPQSNPLDS
jgi:cation:H+ antiporter